MKHTPSLPDSHSLRGLQTDDSHVSPSRAKRSSSDSRATSRHLFSRTKKRTGP